MAFQSGSFQSDAFQVTASDVTIGLTGQSVSASAGSVATSQTVSFGINGLALVPVEGRSNHIKNSTMAGAVAGSPGTIPTYWANVNAGNITLQSVATGTDGTTGLAYIDLRYAGTANANSTVYIAPAHYGNSPIASLGQTWTGSFYAGLVAGSWPSGSCSALFAEINHAGAAASQQTTAINLKTITNSTLVRKEATRTLGGTQVFDLGYVGFRITFAFANTEAVDFTVRIAAPQLELNSSATAFIPTSAGAVYDSLSSSQDVSFALSGQSASASGGTLSASQDVSFALSGQSVSASAGTVAPSILNTVALTGQSVTSSAGTLTSEQSISIALSGQSVSTSSGTITPSTDSSITLQLTGQSVTASAGNATPSIEVTLGLTGQQVSTSGGTVTAEQAITLALSSQQAAASSGSVSTSQDVSLAITGQSVSAAYTAPTVTQAVSVSLTGNSVTSGYGVITPSVTADITLQLNGSYVTAIAGEVGTTGGTPAANDSNYVVLARRVGRR